MSTHELKTWPLFFEAVRRREKTFELRFNDRDYQLHDFLHLREFDPCHECHSKGKVYARVNGEAGFVPCADCAGTGGRYTGRSEWYAVSYLLSNHPGIRGRYVILGLRELTANENASAVLGRV